MDIVFVIDDWFFIFLLLDFVVEDFGDIWWLLGFKVCCLYFIGFESGTFLLFVVFLKLDVRSDRSFRVDFMFFLNFILFIERDCVLIFEMKDVVERMFVK